MKKNLFKILIKILFCLQLTSSLEAKKPQINSNKKIKSIISLDSAIQEPITQKSTTLSMEEAVQLAKKLNPSIKAYKFATLANKELEKKALTGYYPQLTLTEMPSFMTGEENLQNTVAFNANQLIFSFAGPLENHKIAKKSREASEYAEDINKDYIQFQVEIAFLQSWFSQKKNELIKSLDKSSREILKKAENENKLNLLGKNDWLIQAANYATDASTVSYYVDELRNAQNQLEYYIGKSFDNETEKINLIWDENKEIKLKSLDYYYEKALKNRKEIKQKQKEFELYYYTQDYYKKTYLPNVNLTGNVTKNSYDPYAYTSKNSSCSIGLLFTWNMFDGGANYRESTKANAEKMKALMEKDRAVQTAKYDVQKAYNSLSQYLKQLTAQTVRLTQAQNEYNLKKLQLKIGDISQVDLEEAKYNWETQKYNWLSIKISIDIKERELHYACGYPVDF